MKTNKKLHVEKAKNHLKCSFCFKDIIGQVLWANVLPMCEICSEELFGGVNLGLEEELRQGNE